MASVDVTRIASNIGAMNALNSLQNINKQMALHQNRLSTGKRINSASDDPAGLTIATKMLARSEGLKTALANIGDAQNMLSVAESGMSKMNDILVQMRSKAEQAASDTLGTSERAAIQTQLSAYAEQLQNIVDETKWNGVKLLDSTTGVKQFQTGADENEVTSWQMNANLDPFSMSIAKDQSTTGAVAIPTASIQAGTNITTAAGNIVSTSSFANAPALSVGGYSVKVLTKATSATQGAASMISGYTGGLSSLGTVAGAATTTEIASARYQLTVTGIDATSHTATISLKNLDTGLVSAMNASYGAAGGVTAIHAGVATTTADNVGIQLNLNDNVAVGSAISFEYVAQNSVKLEVDDASGQAIQISKNGTDWAKSGKYAYKDLTTNQTFNTGRGVQFTFAANSVATLDTTSVASFDFMGTGKYTVDVSTASKASDYMTKVNVAIDSVTSSLADIGALGARLSFKEDSVSSAQVNVEASYNRIMNANMAEEQVESSKYTILQQTATAMLAQANQAPQFLLSLFR